MKYINRVCPAWPAIMWGHVQESADRHALADQVCEVTSLQRLVLSTAQGSWGSDHARRRSTDLQAWLSDPRNSALPGLSAQTFIIRMTRCSCSVARASLCM